MTEVSLLIRLLMMYTMRSWDDWGMWVPDSSRIRLAACLSMR